ncbi:Endoglucanase Z precursor [compost metagenome]
MNFNGNSLIALRSGSTVLTENVDYTLTDNTVVLKKNFLNQLPVGEHTVVFDFNQGKDAVLKVKVVDSNTPQPQPDATITPTNATFDKAANLGQDVSVTVTLNGHELTSLTRGTTPLVAGQDYTASSNSIVLNKAYLATLPVGQTEITFHFNGGNAAVLTLTVIDSTVVAPAGDVVIQSFNGNTSSSTNGIAPNFKVVNHGDSAIQLSDVKLRYYYTIDGESSQTFWSDWASIGSENVTSTFVKMTTPVAEADYYLEVGFTSAAGSLQPGQSADIQGRFSKSNWSQYDQTNDYSFKALGNQFADNEHITGYLNDQLVWGIEP